MAKPAQAQTDAIPKFLEMYTALSRVGHLAKESPTGKLINEWKTALDAANSKPDLVDITPAMSAILAVKDDEELVSQRERKHPQFPNNGLAESYPYRGEPYFDLVDTSCCSQTGNDTGQRGSHNSRQLLRAN